MRDNVGQFQIFKSDNLTDKFNTRVLHFFSGNKCSVRFFMTWIAAASDFGEQQLLGIDSLFKSNPNACLVIVSKTMEESVRKNVLTNDIEYWLLTKKTN